MPLDNSTIELPPTLRLIARDLKFYYGTQEFLSSRASVALTVKNKTMASYLSLLVKAGVVERIKKGVFRVLADIDPKIVAKPNKLIKAMDAAVTEETPLVPSEYVLKCAAKRMAFPQAQKRRTWAALEDSLPPSAIPSPSRERLMGGR